MEYKGYTITKIKDMFGFSFLVKKEGNFVCVCRSEDTAKKVIDNK